MPEETSFKKKLEAVADWREAVRLGIERFETPCGDEDALTAFNLAETRFGLNAKVDRDAFLDVKRREARIRFLRGDVLETINAVAMVEANDSAPLPVWARLYRVAAMLQLDFGLSVFEDDPEKLLTELSCVSDGDTENLSRKQAIFATALTDFVRRGRLKEDGAKKLLDAASGWGLLDSPEIRPFRDAFAPNYPLPEPPPQIDPEIDRLAKELESANERAGRQTALVKELQERNERQTQTLKHWSTQNSILQDQISELRTRNRMLSDEIAHVKDILKVPSRESEIAALKAAIESLTNERDQALKDGAFYAEESDKSEQRAKSAEKRAEDAAAEIVNMSGQIEVLNGRCAQLQREVESLRRQSAAATDSSDSTEAFEQESPREIVKKTLGGRRILVIAASSNGAKSAIVQKVLPDYGFMESDFEWQDDYAKLTNWSGNPQSASYCGILYGAAPHSMKNKGDYNSLHDKIKAGQGKGFPKMVDMRTSNQELSMTVPSFKQALEELWRYLRQVA